MTCYMKEEVIDTVQLKISCKPDYIVAARLTASAVATRAGFDYEAVEGLKHAVGEACIMIIQYAHMYPENGAELTLQCSVYPSKLTISVDYGTVDQTAPQYTRSHWDVMDVSLTIIRELMDEADVDIHPSQGVRICMTKHLR